MNQMNLNLKDLILGKDQNALIKNYWNDEAVEQLEDINLRLYVNNIPINYLTFFQDGHVTFSIPGFYLVNLTVVDREIEVSLFTEESDQEFELKSSDVIKKDDLWNYLSTKIQTAKNLA